MKKLLSCGFLGIFILGLLVLPGSSQSADEILGKAIEAQGGRKTLASIKDVTTVADMEIIPMGISGSGTMYMKEPNMMRLDMEFMGTVATQAFDGENAWATNMQTGAIEDLPDEMTEIMKNGSYGNAALLEPEKYGIKYAYKGKESIDGKDYLVLDRVHADGYTISMYIDPETYLTYKTKQKSLDEMMNEIVEETVMSDYKKVNGVMTPHVITIIRDGTEFVSLTVTSVEINTGLEDSFFKKGE